VARDTIGGTIARIGLQTQMGPVSLSLSRAQLQAFTSEIYRDDFGPIAARTTLHAGGAFGRRYVIPLRLDLAIDNLANGGRIVRLGSSISTAFGRLWVTNTTDATLFRNVPQSGGADSATGTLRFSRFAADLSLRGEVGYEVRPLRELTTATIAAEWRHFRNADLGATIERNLATHVSRSLVSVRHDTGRYAVALTLEVPSGSSPIARVEISTSLLHNPLAHRFAVDSRPSAAGGAVAALVFLDRNANGVRDEGEPPIAGAGFFVNRGSSPIVTDAGGHAFLTRLPADSQNEVMLNASTLEDPDWAPEAPGAAFVARAGKALVIDFPVVVTGEITGTVSRNGRPAGLLPMELIRADGTVAKRTRTSGYDGFYDFTGVRPGTYSVRVASGGSHSRTVTISAEHTSENADFALTGEKP
ncbi:MAG TPA: carboxypeptidase-like regulatory domain-containing protein, partial [Thermoanaerobaculia bacterium]|nr:carboxypeptidase-like regulatory domain-containing protein [Thermoanaerobaculia bacterium]